MKKKQINSPETDGDSPVFRIEFHFPFEPVVTHFHFLHKNPYQKRVNFCSVKNSMSTRQVLQRASKMVKQEPTLEAMPANYNPNEVEEEEYKPMPANKRKRASKDNGTSAVSALKKPKKVQELAKETISERKTTEGEREGSRIEVMPTAEILTGYHVCVLGCHEEVDDIDMKIAVGQIK